MESFADFSIRRVYQNSSIFAKIMSDCPNQRELTQIVQVDAPFVMRQFYVKSAVPFMAVTSRFINVFVASDAVHDRNRRRFISDR